MKLLLETCASVIAELERLDPASLIAARARGVLDGISAPRTAKPAGGRPIQVDRDQEIARLYGEGLSGPEVANRVGCSYKTVLNALERCGVARRARGTRYSPRKATVSNQDRIERIRTMRAEGLTLKEIGAREKITGERVRQLCGKAGIDTSKRPLTEHEKALVAQYLAGDSLHIVAEAGGLSTGVVARLLALAGEKPRPAPKLRNRHPHTLVNAERAAQLYASGLTMAAIAKHVGLANASSVYRLLAIAGVKLSRKNRAHLRPSPTQESIPPQARAM
ncbi:MAG: hypothetical protein ACOYBT_10035 [Polynucleobacter sp.]